LGLWVSNIDLTGVQCGHGFDDFREAGTIERCRSAASKARKALQRGHDLHQLSLDHVVGTAPPG
jgi:hypothetical protein